MKRSESHFCRDQAQKLLKLAKDCSDETIREHLANMAQNWLAHAKERKCPEGKKITQSRFEKKPKRNVKT